MAWVGQLRQLEARWGWQPRWWTAWRGHLGQLEARWGWQTRWWTANLGGGHLCPGVGEITLKKLGPGVKLASDQLTHLKMLTLFII